jgi:hypothetical protein
VEGSFPDRSFDIAFCQEQGDAAIFAAAWEMVEPAEKISHRRKPTLLLQLLNEFEVEYLIVGGFAVMKYGEPRYTKDLDVWVHNSPQIPPVTSERSGVPGCVAKEGRKHFLRCSGELHFAGRPRDKQTGFGP